MNVIFHTITGVTIGTILSSNRDDIDLEKNLKLKNTRDVIIGFTLGVISHGLLDILPHRYPLKANIDIIVSLIIFILTLFFIKKN